MIRFRQQPLGSLSSPRAGPSRARSALRVNASKSSKSTTPKTKKPSSALAVAATAAAGAAAVAALATVDGLDLEDFFYGDGVTTGLLSSTFSSSSSSSSSSGLPLSLGTAVGAVIWSLGWRLASPAQLLLLFVGRVDGESPAAWAEGILLRKNPPPGRNTPPGSSRSSASSSSSSSSDGEGGGGGGGGGDSSGEEGEEERRKKEKRLVSAIAYLGLFLPSGFLTAFALDASLGDPTWSISSGLGALAAGLLFAAGRPPAEPEPGSGAGRRAAALRAAFESFASGQGDADPFAPPSRRKTILERRGRCHESEVFKAFRRSRVARLALRDLSRGGGGGEAEAAAWKSPDSSSSSSSPTFESEFSDNEIRAEMRSWHGEGGSERRTSQGYWKNLSLVVVEEEDEEE